MLSDLKDIHKLLRQISFKNDDSEPLQPFEQLMANLPPSSAELLPKPYQWLMKSSKSPIVDFYPESFTVDMNGKRWPWEAVVLLPFIDAERLVDASRKLVTNDKLSADEISRNQVRDALVYTRDETVSEDVPALNERRNFGALTGCNVSEKHLNSTSWKDMENDNNVVFRPQLLPGTIVPYPGFPSLKDAPVQALRRRKVGINVFGMRSRYKTAVLEMNSDIPMVASAATLAEKFIGTTLHFRYPFLQEGFVTALSDKEMTVRGKTPPRQWSQKEAQTWQLKNDTIRRQYATGEGLTGSGGWDIPESSVTLSVRPLKEIQTLDDGRKVKVYARLEVEVPFIAALWSPTQPDPRFTDIPARLEKNPYRFASDPVSPSLGLKNISKKGGKGRRNLLPSSKHIKGGKGNKRFTDFSGQKSTTRSVLPPPLPGALQTNIGSSKGYCTLPLQGLQKKKNTTNISPLLKSKQLRLPSMKNRSIGAVAAVAVAFFSKGVSGKMSFSSTPSSQIHNLGRSLITRGGTLERPSSLFEESEETHDDFKTVPPLEFAHGTTTLSFTFDGGIVAAVDSRASIGNFVGSKTTQKVLPISDHILGTMAGGAADCSFWIRRLQTESRYYELSEGKPISVARVARVLADYLYENRGFDLSVGTMIMGFDEYGPSIYYVDNSGSRLKGDMFAVGSGSTFALGVLDTEKSDNMKEEEAIALGIKAIRHATFRDAFSGGYIAVYVIKESGWTKVFSEDLALIDTA
jgi:20S proteasome subunit beta 5